MKHYEQFQYEFRRKFPDNLDAGNLTAVIRYIGFCMDFVCRKLDELKESK